jgi:glycerol-3-phosphate O-acyltransferase
VNISPHFLFMQGRELFTKTLYDTVVNQYNVLKSAIVRGHGEAASSPVVSLSQPWR